MNPRSVQRYGYRAREMPAGLLHVETTGGRLRHELGEAAAAASRLASTRPAGRNGNPVLVVFERPAGGGDA